MTCYVSSEMLHFVWLDCVWTAGEPGQLVGKIVKGQPLREFDGYANPEATKKKVAHNVFKKGDCYFLTGKLLLLKSNVIFPKQKLLFPGHQISWVIE